MVFVDTMRAEFRRMVMCHMIADTRQELLAMCKKIKVQAKWIQEKDTIWEHFDICLSKKKQAIAFGAEEVSIKTLVKKCLAREDKKISRKYLRPQK